MAKPSSIKPLGASPEYIRMMLAAEPGFGKTVFAGTAPKALFLTTDPEGTLSAKRLGSTADEWKIESGKDLADAHTYLRTEGHKEYDWVILDNATEAQLFFRSATMAAARARNPQRDEFVPGLDDHQRSQNMIVDYIKKLYDLPMHVLITSHIVMEEDADGEPLARVAIHGQQGALARQCMGYANILGYGIVIQDDDGNDHRRIYFSHHGGYRGKERFTTIGAFRDDLTIPRLTRLAFPQTTAKTAAKKTPTKTATTRRTTATRAAK